MNILKKAESVPRKRSPKINWTDDEYIELALAWLRGEVTNSQVSVAIAGKTGSSYNFLYGISTALKCAYKKGLIK